jgi:hypothetical protein
MNRERFEHLLEAYGADFARWPASERAAAAAYAAQHAGEIAPALVAARALDAALDAVRGAAPDAAGLSQRVLAAAPVRSPGLDRRAGWALAACAVFGAALGYGGGLMAPASAADDEYFSIAFEAPQAIAGEGG